MNREKFNQELLKRNFLIFYVDKSVLKPKNGDWIERKDILIPSNNNDNLFVIRIRNDLASDKSNFVLLHEKFHVIDTAKFWLWREIKANYHAFKWEFKGGVKVLCHALFSTFRLKYYFNRFKDKK